MRGILLRVGSSVGSAKEKTDKRWAREDVEVTGFWRQSSFERMSWFWRRVVTASSRDAIVAPWSSDACWVFALWIFSEEGCSWLVGLVVSILLPVDCGLDREVKKLVQQLNSLNTYKFSSSIWRKNTLEKVFSPLWDAGEGDWFVRPGLCWLPYFDRDIPIRNFRTDRIWSYSCRLPASLSLISSKTPAESSR